jgi:hypothetical protein
MSIHLASHCTKCWHSRPRFRMTAHSDCSSGFVPAVARTSAHTILPYPAISS